ncbi:hypothetical protein [Actinacidiphila soli]|jgi:hypothetical protein|uniref:hypothetical protein n=1 Tax=Actinacidiphila soli TaxID=2487275 RepID=UPI000FCA44F5|nr:hypothetical protein [Actinacidiphila soli]
MTEHWYSSSMSPVAGPPPRRTARSSGPPFGEVFGDRLYGEPESDLRGLPLGGYGFRWIRLNRRAG